MNAHQTATVTCVPGTHVLTALANYPGVRCIATLGWVSSVSCTMGMRCSYRYAYLPPRSGPVSLAGGSAVATYSSDMSPDCIVAFLRTAPTCPETPLAFYFIIFGLGQSECSQCRMQLPLKYSGASYKILNCRQIDFSAIIKRNFICLSLLILSPLWYHSDAFQFQGLFFKTFLTSRLNTLSVMNVKLSINKNILQILYATSKHINITVFCKRGPN